MRNLKIISKTEKVNIDFSLSRELGKTRVTPLIKFSNINKIKTWADEVAHVCNI